MKKQFELLYWAGMIAVLSLILMSAMGSFGQAFFLSLMLLPGILFVKYFWKGLPTDHSKKSVFNWICFVAAALLIEYLGIILAHTFLYDYGQQPPEKADILFNPFFIWFLLIALLAFEKGLKAKFFSSVPEEKYITFISERVKVSLEIDSVAYIESRDYEVLVMTVSGKSYPTRMKISQWESVLDNRFIRVHRSFIVNRKHISRFDSKTVYIGELPIDISRKYKENVLTGLEKNRLS